MVSGAAGSGVFSVVIEALLTARRQEVGRVADPGLEGGQVAVLRLHAASSRRVTFAAYSRKGEHSLELASHLAKFAEFTFQRLSRNSVGEASTRLDRSPATRICDLLAPLCRPV